MKNIGVFLCVCVCVKLKYLMIGRTSRLRTRARVRTNQACVRRLSMIGLLRLYDSSGTPSFNVLEDNFRSLRAGLSKIATDIQCKVLPW